MDSTYGITGVMFLIRKLANAPFTKGVIAIAGGTAVAQLVNLVLSPILTRLYAPQDMGMWGLFISYISIMSIFAALRYELAIVAARNNDALALTATTMSLVLVTSIISGFIFELLRRVDLLGYGSFPVWATPLSSLALLFSAWAVVLRYWSVRKGHYATIGKYSLTQTIVRSISQIVLPALGPAGLIIGETLGRYAGARVYMAVLPKLKLRINKKMLLTYLQYPRTMLIPGALNQLSLFLIVPAFSAAFGVAVGGHVALAQRVLTLPMSLIGTAVADVYYGHAARMAREAPNMLYRFTLKLAFRLFLIAVPLGLGIWIAAPEFSSLVFGDDWTLAGELMQAQTPWIVAAFVVSPLSRLIFLTKYTWLQIPYEVATILVLLLPLISHYSNPVQAVGNIALYRTLLYTIYLLIILMLSININKVYIGGGDEA